MSLELSDLRSCMKLAGITRVANVTGLDTVGIPVVVVVRPNSRSLSVSQGKGLTLEAARMSGVMESLETFVAETPELALWLGTSEELARSARIADCATLPRSLRAFHPAARLLWTRAEDLATGEFFLVPYELVHLDMTEPLPDGSGFFAFGSNGLASQATRVRAQLHGIWELIERDALALFYARHPAEQQRRRIRISSVKDPSSVNLIRRFESAGVGVALWDMTTDVGIAAVLCSAGEHQFDPLRPVGAARGFGCHPDRAVALQRALTEAAQSRLTRIAGSRDDIQADDFAEIRGAEAIERQRRYLSEETLATRSFEELPSQSSDSTQAQLDFTLQRLTASGLKRVLSVELKKRDFPIAVERIIIPGLEGVPDAPTYLPGPRVQALLRAVDE